MNTINVTIQNIDREELRLLIAALRDKRAQMIDTAGRDPEGPAGDQAHRMAAIIDQLKQAYERYPAPKVRVEICEPALG